MWSASLLGILSILLLIDVYADEIVVTYTYETITTPETTVLVSYTVDVSGKIRLIVFGDNTNDISMFTVADRCYAVSNATLIPIVDRKDQGMIAFFFHNTFYVIACFISCVLCVDIMQEFFF